MTEFTHPEPAAMLVDMVLFAQPPSLEAVTAALEQSFSHPVEAAGEGTVVIDADGVEVYVALMPGPVPDGEALGNCHPVYWQSGTEPVAEHRSTVVVTGRVDEQHRDEWSPRSGALVLRAGIARATVTLLHLSEAVGVYAGSSGTTFPARVYAEMTAGELDEGVMPAMMWAPVWLLDGGDGTWSGYSYGLAPLGHAELQMEGVAMSPNDLFTLLTDLVSYVVDGATLLPGQTISLYEDSPALQIGTGAWAADATQTALLLHT